MLYAFKVYYAQNYAGIIRQGLVPVHYVIGHRVRVREHCSRLSCIQSRLPSTGRLDRDRPSRTSDRGRGDGTCPADSGASIDD